MKKSKLFIALLTIISLCAMLCLTACNADIGWGSYSFHYVHVQMYSMNEPVHFEVDKWKGDDGGIELATKKHGTILLGDGTYVMYDTEECPLCGHVEYK